MVVPSISLKALISALINVKSDFISVASVGIIVLLVGEGDGEDLVKITGVELVSDSLLIFVSTKKVKLKFIRLRKKIIIKTLAYLSIIICYYKYSIILVAKHMKNPFIISGLFFLFSIAFLFVFFNKTSRDLLIEQVQHRQQLSVRAGAKSIDSFITAVGRSNVILAHDVSQDKLHEFIDEWSTSGVSGIIATDKNGIVLYNSNTLKLINIGVDVSDRDYFAWSKTAKEGEYKVFPPIISKVGATKGEYIVTVSTPIFHNSQFDGVLTTAVLLTSLTKEYLGDLRILDSSKIYLVTESGEIVYSDVSEITGRNFKDIFDTDFLGKEKVFEIVANELKKDTESKLQLAIPNFQNGLALEPYLISAAPVSISDNLWKLVAVTPEKSLLTFTYKIFSGQIMAAFIVATLFIVLVLRVSRNTGYQEAVTDEHKIHNIKS